jgi:D-amino-acid oxidase
MKSASNLLAAPDLSDEKVLRAVCGLRPCRRGGLRIESDQIGSKTVIHNYGHGGCGVTISFGSAEVACDLVEESSDKGQSVAVLGAGVIGLTVALELAERGYHPTIYSEHAGNKTTSGLAGALWLPVGVEFGSDPDQQKLKKRILHRSHQRFSELDRSVYGVELMRVYEPTQSHTTHSIESDLFESGILEQPVGINSFPFECDATAGRRFDADFIHTPIFLDALMARVNNLDIPIIVHRFDDLSELEALEESIIVNCLALGSGALFNDENVYSARGVLVHLESQDLGYIVHDGYKYMFPRKDALILGGCFQEDRWDSVPDQLMIDAILNHHRRFFGQMQ